MELVEGGGGVEVPELDFAAVELDALDDGGMGVQEA